MQVTKEHAALAQLETAIWLYFEDIDPISVHTLANAAGEALDGCCDAAGQVSMWQIFKGYIKPENWNELQSVIRVPYNYFKHKSDPAGFAEFTDDHNIFFLFRACVNAQALHIRSDFCGVFMTWLGAVEPQWLAHFSDPDGLVQKAYGNIVGHTREDQKSPVALYCLPARDLFVADLRCCKNKRLAP